MLGDQDLKWKKREEAAGEEEVLLKDLKETGVPLKLPGTRCTMYHGGHAI